MTVLTPASPSTPAPADRPSTRADWPADLVRGTDPETGRAATWRVVPLSDSASGECCVERAEGHITHPAVWMQAARTSRVMSRDEALALLAAVTS